jgi:hypothetical protein
VLVRVASAEVAPVFLELEDVSQRGALHSLTLGVNEVLIAVPIAECVDLGARNVGLETVVEAVRGN